MLCVGSRELIESRRDGTAPKDDPQLCVGVCLFVLRGLELGSASLIRQSCPKLQSLPRIGVGREYGRRHPLVVVVVGRTACSE